MREPIPLERRGYVEQAETWRERALQAERRAVRAHSAVPQVGPEPEDILLTVEQAQTVAAALGSMIWLALIALLLWVSS